MKSLLFLFFTFICFHCFAQIEKFDQSEPLDLSQSGCYKTLCMKNGNTAL